MSNDESTDGKMTTVLVLFVCLLICNVRNSAMLDQSTNLLIFIFQKKLLHKSQVMTSEQKGVYNYVLYCFLYKEKIGYWIII